jgi:hypothetical protein
MTRETIEWHDVKEKVPKEMEPGETDIDYVMTEDLEGVIRAYCYLEEGEWWLADSGGDVTAEEEGVTVVRWSRWPQGVKKGRWVSVQ